MRHAITKYFDILSENTKPAVRMFFVSVCIGVVSASCMFLVPRVQANEDSVVRGSAHTSRPSELFDIRLSLDVSDIATASELSARAEFNSFGRVPTPVALMWIIRDAENKEVYRSSAETLVVETELSYPRRFADAPKLAAGTYTLVLATKYRTDVHDEFAQSFTVAEPIDDLFPFAIIGFMTLVGGVWVVYFLMHHQGRVSHERMVALTSKAAVFLLAGAVLPSASFLVAERENTAMQTGAVYVSLLGQAAQGDIAAFVAHANTASEEYLALKNQAIYGDDASFVAKAYESSVVDALHIVDVDEAYPLSAYRTLGFTPASSSMVSVPSARGLVQGNDQKWVNIVQFPRAAGGYYVVQTSFDDVITGFAKYVRANDEVFLLSRDGTVLTSSGYQRKGEQLFAKYPDMHDMIRNNEYYEGTCQENHLFTSHHVYVPTSDGYETYYLVTIGHHETQASRFAF